MPLLPQDPDQRKKLLLGFLLVCGLGYLGYERVYLPREAEATALEARLETIRTQNQVARAVASEATGQADMDQQVAVSTSQLAAVENLIPSSEELPDLLNAIAAQAQSTGVELSLIQPTGATEETYYTRRTYDLAALGSYHDIADFLTRTASLPRIVIPTNLTLTTRPEPTRDGEQRLEARFSIETYVVSSTPENAAAN